MVLTKYSDWWVAGRAWPPGGELGLTLSHCPTRGEAFLSLAPSSGHLQTPPALRILQFHFSESIIVVLYFVLENYLWGEMQRFYFFLVADSNSFQENKSRLNFSQD